MNDEAHPGGFGPGTYGRSFADVYDQWYPSDSTSAEAVEGLSALAGPGGRILELGVGTGRLAIPLAIAGHEVSGVDASPEMLAALAENLTVRGLAPGSVRAVLGDVGAPADWPTGPFDLVVGAFNLVCNLHDGAAQRRMFRTAHGALAPGGRLALEAFLPPSMDRRERRLELREVTATSVVLIATDSDPESGTVVGQHVELRDGAPARLRPWRICMAEVDDLDSWAVQAGLVLHRRSAGWSGDPFDPHGASHVSIYERPT